MRRQFNNIVSVVYSGVRFALLKLFHGKNLDVAPIERFSPNVVVEMNKNASLKIASKVRVHSGSKIKVRSGAKLHLGNGVKINYNCIIACHDQIEIGDGTEFGPGVLVYDHDHDYRAGLKNETFRTSPVKIGKNCWIGAHTIILRGTVLGDNCVVGAGAVIKGQYDANTVIIQKRQEETRHI